VAMSITQRPEARSRRDVELFFSTNGLGATSRRLSCRDADCDKVDPEGVVITKHGKGKILSTGLRWDAQS